MDDAQAKVLEHVSAVMQTSEERLYAQVNSTFNWLLATLFTGNGGALVALLGNETISAKLPAIVLGFFAVGVVSSVLMAVANAVYAAKALMPTTELRMTLACMVGGTTAIGDVEKKIAALNEMTWLKWPMYGFGFLSLACLVGGMVSYACAA